MYIVGKQFLYSDEMFSNTVSSLCVGSFFAKENTEISSWNCDSIKTKVCALPYNDGYAIVPLVF